jgi:aspartyl-tRNA(Asn)/glutamyl-tRNA(Gln) amidotransferase subunit A
MVGNYFSEERMLRAAHHFQRATDWHQRTPEGIV